jgi:hypothetical protein
VPPRLLLLSRECQNLAGIDLHLSQDSARIMKRKIPIHSGSGNVFADIGLPDPEEYLAKSTLAAKIFVIIKRKSI